MLGRTRSFLALLVGTALLAGCGATASSPPEQPGAARSPVASAPGRETEAPSGAPSIDLGAAAEALYGIDSFRMRMTLEGTTAGTVDGVIVRKPDPAQELTMNLGGPTQRVLVVGEKAWMDPGTGSYAPMPSELATTMAGSFDPTTLLGGFNDPQIRQGLERVGEETRNGVATTHYRYDAESEIGQEGSFPPGSTMDVWLAKPGYLVSFEARDLNRTLPFLRLDVTNVNDPSNKVTAPAEPTPAPS